MSDIIKENAPYPEFARRLRALRKASGLTREELGQRCGITGRTIVNYEMGTRMPDADVATKMAAIFGVTVEDLIGMKYEDYSHEQVKSKTLDNIRQMYGKRGEDQAKELLDGTSSLLAGGTLTKDQQDDFILEMQKLFIIATENAKAKYTPKKYRTEEKAEESKKRLQAADDIDQYLEEKNRSYFSQNDEND